METKTNTTTGPAFLDDPRIQGSFASAQRSIGLYGALTAAALTAVVVVAACGHTVNGFMWVRAVLPPLIILLIHRMTVSVAGGSRRAFERLSGLTVVMPIAIIGVDFVPGVCPLWYALMQSVCMLPVIHLAFLTRGSALRGAFPKAR
ncbi:hypothetical protein ACFCV9_07815 [Streptomyces sp. NPDC056367]|uniref:hypothetical protein n=1 Tax=Streptomyces sp. NPDC056367 TaxID=3345797 RepID=UPI0035DE1932